MDFRPHTRDFRVTLVLTGLSFVGVLLGVGIAVNIPSWAVKVYVGVLVLVIGLITLRTHRREIPFSWRRIGGLGLVAAFNKGISGGGYGPVVTGGQVLSGIEGRSAVGIGGSQRLPSHLGRESRPGKRGHPLDRDPRWQVN